MSASKDLILPTTPWCWGLRYHWEREKDKEWERETDGHKQRERRDNVVGQQHNIWKKKAITKGAKTPCTKLIQPLNGIVTQC